MATRSRTILSVARGWALATTGLAALLAASATATAATPRLERVGSVARPPAGSRLLGALARPTTLHLSVALEPRDPLALENYANEVATPGSSEYHQYLTPTQFASRFGATPSQIETVESSLRAQGLAPGKPSVNALSIPVTAHAGTIESAFKTTLQRVELPSRRLAIVNDTAPALDAKVATLVQGVIGLQTLSAPRPLLARRSAFAPATAHATRHVATGGPQPCTAATAVAPSQNAYTIDQIASAYGFTGLYNAGDQGQGQTIALYELEPNDPADIDAYQSCYGTEASVQYVPIDGGAGVGAGSGEAALDIETAVGLAPKANFLVYQGPNSNSNGPGAGPYDLFNAIVSEDRASVISASWGQCESLEGATDAGAEQTLFEEAAVQGQSFVSATGDEGSEDCYSVGGGLANTQLAVDDPSSQPFVTAAGGTSLTSIGATPTETVWNAHCVSLLLDLTCGSGASGGGSSSLWPMPPYQSGAAAFLNAGALNCSRGSGRCRATPDVSADADPNTGYLIYWNGSGSDRGQPTGWQGIGGTSAAAPTWAAVIALANASTGCQGSPIGFANPAIYRSAGIAYSDTFNDVTSGNNDFTGTNRGMYGAAGAYDMATGIGTPKATALARTMCAQALRIPNPGNQTSLAHGSVKLKMTASVVDGGSTSYAATGLPAGLTIDKSSGLISGRPTKIGTRKVTVAAVDTDADTASATFTWTIAGRPAISRASLTGVPQGRPKLSFTATRGRDGSPLHAVSIRLPHGLRFASKPRKLTVKSAGKRAKHTASVKHGVLTIKLATPATSVRVSIAYASLTASQSLVGRHGGKLKFTIAPTDASGNTASLTVKLRP
jgi:subtilase family serine protease